MFLEFTMAHNGTPVLVNVRHIISVANVIRWDEGEQTVTTEIATVDGSVTNVLESYDNVRADVEAADDVTTA